MYRMLYKGPKTQLLFLSCTLPPASVCLEQKFKSVSKVDAGMYRCESSNSVGAPKSCVAQQLKVIDCKYFKKVLTGDYASRSGDQILKKNLILLLPDPLNMTILIAGTAGLAAFMLFCCICVCVCRHRGCCKSK